MNDDTMTPARKFAEQFMQYQPREFDTPAAAAIDAFKAGYAAAEAEAEGDLGTDWKQLCLRAQEDQKALLADRERLRAELAEAHDQVEKLLVSKREAEGRANRADHDLVGLTAALNGWRAGMVRLGIPTHPATGAHRHDAVVLMNDMAMAAQGKTYMTYEREVEYRNEVKGLRAELLKWRPLTEEEAEEAFEKAEAAPLSDERIAEIVDRAVDPAARISNDEQMQLAVRVQQLESELVDRDDWKKAEAERTALLDAIRDDAKKAIRDALGKVLWDRFWGPELERLGSVVYDVWIERERMRRRAEEMQEREAMPLPPPPEPGETKEAQ